MVQVLFLEVVVLDDQRGFPRGPASQLMLLCKKWRDGQIDASQLFWREIRFFVLIQISPCSLQKSSWKQRSAKRGPFLKSPSAGELSEPGSQHIRDGAVLRCVLTDEMPSLCCGVDSEPVYLETLSALLWKRAERTEKRPRSYISVVKPAECVDVGVFQKPCLHADCTQRRCSVTDTPRISGGGQLESAGQKRKK